MLTHTRTHIHTQSVQAFSNSGGEGRAAAFLSGSCQDRYFFGGHF